MVYSRDENVGQYFLDCVPIFYVIPRGIENCWRVGWFNFFLVSLSLCCHTWASSGCSKRRLLCCGGWGSFCSGFCCCGAQALGSRALVVVTHRLISCGSGSVTVVHGVTCSVARGIFPAQGSNPWPLLWQEDSYPLYFQGRPSKFLTVSFHEQEFFILMKVYLCPPFWAARFAFYFSIILPTPRS